MQSWDELLRLAMLGTARSSEPFPKLPSPLAALLADNADPPEQRLLHAAALLDQYRRLGSLPAPVATAPAMAPGETLPACDEPVADLLRGLLAEEEHRLLKELLIGMAALPCRVPADTLPALLDLALTREELLTPLLVVGGERLGWLAAQHRQWSTLLGAPDDDPWLTGGTASRVAFLRRERARDPDAARERLASGFAQEGARERLAFLECLGDGLGAADVAFLEACLEDRSQPVRQLATRFLVRLGDNPTAELVRAQVASMVSVQKGLRKQLAVELPENFDKRWQRLGLREKPGGGQSMGKKTFWLIQWLELLGPSRLAALLEVDLDTLAKLSRRGDFAKELKAMLLDSAVSQTDVPYVVWRLERAGASEFVHFFAELAEILPMERRDALLGEFLDRHSNKLAPDDLHAMAAAVGYLSAATTRRVVDIFPMLCERLKKNRWLGRDLEELALYLAPGEAERLETLCQDHSELAGVPEFWQRYERRCRIYQALGDLQHDSLSRK